MQKPPADRSPQRSVIVSIHDVSPRFEEEILRLRDLVSLEIDEARLALLVVPDYWQKSPIVAGSAFAGRLRRWADQGNEIFLHGWSHRDRSTHSRAIDRFRARHWTAGEGEFLGLDRTEACELLRQGRDLLQDVTGHPVSGFVAPAWLYGRGALAALAELEFPLAEDHFKVWHPPSGRVLARGPVISWASRSPGRILSSIGFAAAARWLLADLPEVRIALHPSDVGVPRLRESISTTLAHFAQGRVVGRYADLLADQDCPVIRSGIAIP